MEGITGRKRGNSRRRRPGARYQFTQVRSLGGKLLQIAMEGGGEPKVGGNEGEGMDPVVKFGENLGNVYVTCGALGSSDLHCLSGIGAGGGIIPCLVESGPSQ